MEKQITQFVESYEDSCFNANEELKSRKLHSDCFLSNDRLIGNPFLAVSSNIDAHNCAYGYRTLFTCIVLKPSPISGTVISSWYLLNPYSVNNILIGILAS